MSIVNINLIIVHEDNRYTGRFLRCFGEFHPQTKISSFSGIDKITDSVSRISADVILVSEDIYDNCKDNFSLLAAEKMRCKSIIILTKSRGINKLGEYPAVCQYQMIDDLYNEIVGIYAEQTDALLNISSGSGRTAVTAFMSGAGGCGCSTAAAAYSVYLASLGNKVIYIDMGSMGIPEKIFEGAGNYTMTDCFTALLSKKNNINVQLETYSRKDVSEVRFYSSCVNALDWSDITSENKVEFLTAVIFGSSYDHVVVDLPCIWDDVSAFMYEKSDKFYIVSDGRSISNAKNIKLLDMIFTYIRSNNSEPSKLMAVYSDYSENSFKLQDNRIDEYTVLPKIEKYRNIRELVVSLSEPNIWDR